MKLIITLSLIISSHFLCHAQTEPVPDKKETTLHTLFNTREKVEFSKTVIEAKKLEISEQVILEATFLYHIDKREHASIVELTPKFEKLLSTFDANESKVFGTVEDWKSVIEYGRALKALQSDDIVLFKKHITEAFWLSPSKAGAFAPHIIKLHTNAALKKVKLDLEREMFQVDKEQSTTMKKMLDAREAVILRFWSPWNQQVDNTYPMVKNLAKQCAANKIAFASILINRDEQGLKDTKEVIKELGDDLPSVWLADDDKSSLTKILRVADLPTIVLIAKDGSIIYHGGIMDGELWKKLTDISPQMKPISD